MCPFSNDSKPKHKRNENKNDHPNKVYVYIWKHKQLNNRYESGIFQRFGERRGRWQDGRLFAIWVANDTGK